MSKKRTELLYQKCLLRWCNSKMYRHSIDSEDELLKEEMAPLSDLLNSLSRDRYSKTRKSAKTQLLGLCQFLKKEKIGISGGVKSLETNIGIGRADLLVLLSDLMLHYSVKMPLLGAVDSDDPRKMLLSWINFPLKSSYSVNNFADDWKDGRALGSLLNSIHRDMCPDWSKWDYENCEANITLAMNTAEEYLLGVEKLIDPGDMCNPAVVDIVVITYLSQLLSATLILPGNKFRKVLNDRTNLGIDYETWNDIHGYEKKPPPLPGQRPPCPLPYEKKPPPLPGQRPPCPLPEKKDGYPISIDQTIPKCLEYEQHGSDSNEDDKDTNYYEKTPPPLPPKNFKSGHKTRLGERYPAREHLNTESTIYSNRNDAEESNNLEISHLPFDARKAYNDLYKKVEYEHKRREIHKDGNSVYYKIRGRMNDRFDVFLVKTNITGSKVEAVILEAHTQSLLDHDNVTKVIALTVHDGELHTIMPWMNCVILQPYLIKTKEFDVNERLDIVEGIAKAMEYLADRDYVLQNLTTETCMVSNERKVKIYDLSCIAELDDNGTAELKQDIDTFYRNLPPEVFDEKVFHRESDVYVYGIFVWTVFNESFIPYEDDDVYSVLSRKTKDRHLPKTDNMPGGIYHLLTRCWAECFSNRPTFREVIDELHKCAPEKYVYISYTDSDNEPQI